MRSCSILGAPVETGASQPGCLMGPSSLRTAGLVSSIRSLGWDVSDLGDVSIAPLDPRPHDNPSLRNLAETCAWIETLCPRAYAAAQNHDLPIFIGGDHSLSAGTVPG